MGPPRQTRKSHRKKAETLLDEGHHIGILTLQGDVSESCWGLISLLDKTINDLEASLEIDSGLQMRKDMLDGKPQNYRRLGSWAELIEARESHLHTVSELMAEFFEIGLKEQCWSPEKRSKLR